MQYPAVGCLDALDIWEMPEEGCSHQYIKFRVLSEFLQGFLMNFILYSVFFMVFGRVFTATLNQIVFSWFEGMVALLLLLFVF